MTALGIALALPLSGMCNAPAPDAAGNLREGIWKLNRERSSQLAPADQTLWVVKDDGRQLVWVIVSVDAQGRVGITSWNGSYGGEPMPVTGADMVSQMSSSAPGTIQSRGEIKGLGPFSEDCKVLESGKRFVCHGEVRTQQGVRRWVDDFEWIAAGPK